jgi:hypothetical protein
LRTTTAGERRVSKTGALLDIGHRSGEPVADIIEDVPRRLAIHPYDSKKWRAELLSRGRVNLHADEAWSDVDITVTYQPFFFFEPETISHHNKLGVSKPAEGT